MSSITFFRKVLSLNKINHRFVYHVAAAIAQSVQRFATGWTVPGSNHGGGEVKFSPPVQTGHEAHPVSYTMSTRSFLEVKRPGAWRWQPTPSSAVVQYG